MKYTHDFKKLNINNNVNWSVNVKYIHNLIHFYIDTSGLGICMYRVK